MITIDFETFYGRGYSLTKLTTEEYINHSDFEIIGVAVKQGDQETEWFSGTFEETKEFLYKFDWSTFCLAHNTLFDGAILKFKFGLSPKLGWLDTLCMGRALHGVEQGASLKALSERYNIGEKGTEVHEAKDKRKVDFSEQELKQYAKYCKNDVELTYKLFKCLVKSCPLSELQLIHTTLNMYLEPVLNLQVDLLTKQLKKVLTEKKKILNDCGQDRETIMSNQKFAMLLENLGVEPPTKISPRTGKETLALAKTDVAFLDLLKHKCVPIKMLAEARLSIKSTIEETRLERFIGVAQRMNNKLPIPLKYYGAHTGRWSGSDKVNLQNLPSRDKEKSVIKKALVAPDGYVIINCDSSQIEARVLAWLSGQDNVVKQFADKQDVYKIMASKIYNKEVEKISPIERFVGKTAVLGCGYGTGWQKFQSYLKVSSSPLYITDEESKAIVGSYRKVNNKVVELWNQADKMLELFEEKKGEDGIFGVRGVPNINANCFELPNSFKIRYPKLKHKTENNRIKFSYESRDGEVNIWGGSVVENVVQALARCIVAEQLLLISKQYKVALTVHDSVVCVARESEIEEALSYVQNSMNFVPQWAKGLPLSCEATFGKSYGDC
tara:strand:+ start:5549 stop:7378 length:1830 start_codon:yes stop_codon:yes gene_type:complete